MNLVFHKILIYSYLCLFRLVFLILNLFALYSNLYKLILHNIDYLFLYILNFLNLYMLDIFFPLLLLFLYIYFFLLPLIISDVKVTFSFLLFSLHCTFYCKLIFCFNILPIFDLLFLLFYVFSLLKGFTDILVSFIFYFYFFYIFLCFMSTVFCFF